MKKTLLILFCNLFVFCLALLFAKSAFASQYESYLKFANQSKSYFADKQITDEGKKSVVNPDTESDGSDFIELGVDFSNKIYEPGKVTVTDSEFEISAELLKKININTSGFGAGLSFYIVNLTDGMTVGYNVDKSFETASSIKAPYALYIYRQIANGSIDPNMEITYTAQHFNSGTGIVKKSPFGTKYKVADLLYISLNYSDNIAHIMLHKTFGATGYNDLLKSLKAEKLYLTAANPWGYTNARSAALVWQDIYQFSFENEVGIELFNILENNKYNYFKEVRPDLASASKTGFAYTSVIENGIVFDHTPYVAIAMASKNGNWGAYNEVLKLIGFMDEIMQEYYTYLEVN